MAAAVETTEYGIAPVPARARLLGLFDSFVLWADLGISLLVIVAGALLPILAGLGLTESLLAIVVGALIGNALLGLAAAVGSHTAVPTMVLFRPSLGLRGSYVPTALNVLQLVGWAALEFIVMALVADEISRRVFGLSLYLGWVALFAIVATLMALGGPLLVVRRWMRRFAVWLALAATLWLTLQLLSAPVRPPTVPGGPTPVPAFWYGVDLVVALPISWVPLVADYSRFSRRPAQAFWGTSLGYLLVQVWLFALGVVLAINLGVSTPAALIGAIADTVGTFSLLVLLAVLLGLLVGEADEGFANVYSTVVSLQNLYPSASQRVLTVVVGVACLALAGSINLLQYELFLIFIGSFFVPLVGILTADFFVLSRRRYDLQAIYQAHGRYWYAGGVNLWGMAAWAVGVAAYIAIGGIPAMGLAGQLPWLGSTIPSFAIAFALYLGLAQAGLLRPRESVSGGGAA